MSSQKPRTYQDLLQRRQQSEFVGREDQIAQFRRNLGYALDDERRRFIFNVHGPGGVGKTWLLRRCFEPIAQERGLLTAYSDEEQSDVLQVMGCLARQLAAQGHPLETFAARYRTYEERRHEIGADPHTPSFPPLDLARAPDRIRRRRTRRPPAPRLTSRQRRRNRLLSLLVTGFDEEELRTLCFSLDVDHDSLRGEGKEGKARELVALLDRQERLDELVHAGAEQRPHLDWHAPPDSPLQRAAFEGDLAGEVALGPRDEFAAYVTRQLRDPQAARLVLGPMQALTPPFLQDLAALAAQRPLLLCFDTYEHMGAFLDPWLREVVRGERYGALAAEVLLVVAGREELERQSWAPLEGLVARVPLAPFTEQEARDYLARKGVTHEPVIEVILRLSGRLPLLVSTLAAQSPADPAQVGDPSGEAVARFLKWVEDPRRKQVALDAALPRHLNQDVLALLAGDEEAGALFDWLRGQPFVRKRGESWTYHPVVREHLLRYKRQRTPQGWANLHGQLAAHYERLRDDTGLEPEAGRKDATWQAHALEALYHSLCESPPRNLPVALNGFALALKAGRALARRWAETMQQAGEDAQAAEVARWGERLVDGLLAYEEDRYRTAIPAFTALLERTDLEEPERAVARGWRGYLYSLVNQYPKAVADLSEAVRLAPADAENWRDRGETYRLMGRYEEALADLDRALELEPDDAWAIATRGVTYRLMRRYTEALADLNQAIELEPDYAWAIATRGMMYRRLGHHKEALADLDRALELTPDVAWYIFTRSGTYREMERYEEALADLDRAIELKPDNALYISTRSGTYQEMGHYAEALVDLDRAIELKPDDVWYIFERGETYRRIGRYEEALADLNRALELEPDYDWTIVSRSETYRLMGRYAEALADLDRAIELESDYDRYYYERGLLRLVMGTPQQAQADLAQAISLACQTYAEDPQDWRNTFNLALYHLAAGEARQAEDLYRQALDGSAPAHSVREAIQDLDDFLRHFPAHPQARAMRELLGRGG